MLLGRAAIWRTQAMMEFSIAWFDSKTGLHFSVSVVK
jgi:hypothetical protein